MNFYLHAMGRTLILAATCLLGLAEGVDGEYFYLHLGPLVQPLDLHGLQDGSPTVPPSHYFVLPRGTRPRVVQ